MAQTDCYHCGEPIPPGFHGELAIRETPRQFCCIGCMAIAEILVTNKLDNFYQHRTQLSQKPDPLTSMQEAELRLYDDVELQNDFVEVTPDGDRIAALNVQGITCAACIWLLEREINSLPGIISFSINHTSHKARLHWQPAQKQESAQQQGQQDRQLSTVLFQIVRLGFKAFPYQEDRARKASEQERKRALFRLALAGIAMMQSMMFTVPLYLSGYGTVDIAFIDLFRWVSLVICTPVVLISAKPFYTATLRDLKLRHLTMDVPISVAIILAFLASSYITVFTEPSFESDVYFDSIAMFVFLLLLGRFFEMQTRQKHLNSDADMQQLLPATALLEDSDTREERNIPAHRIQAGDRIIVRQGQIAPVDGIVCRGQSRFDESALTGEYLPIAKNVDSTIHAGTANIENTVVIIASGPVSQSRVAAIVRLIDQALAEKPPTVEMADKIASHFISVVLISTVLSGVFWYLHEPDKVMVIMLAVLIATCPCALSLATPTAMTAANIALRKIGFLITRGHALEALSTTTDVIFDKTGTLSEARLHVTKVCTFGDIDEASVLEITAALEAESNHPIASAFKNFYRSRAEQVINVSGSGLSGIYQGKTWYLGTLAFVRKNGQALAIIPEAHTGVLVWFSDDTQVLAQIQLNDQLRNSAPECIRQLRDLGMTVHILSGDHQASVEQTARTLNIAHYQYAQAPEQKLAYVQQLEKQGKKVAMIGDGINDLPVLSGAQLSIAMGSASDLAKLNSDAILLNSHLEVLARAFHHARRSRRIIQQNLLWSALYNLGMIPLAAAGLVPPFIAAIGMSSSSLLVVFNSLRLRGIKE